MDEPAFLAATPFVVRTMSGLRIGGTPTARFSADLRSAEKCSGAHEIEESDLSLNAANALQDALGPLLTFWHCCSLIWLTSKQQCLYLVPLPHGHGAFRPTRSTALTCLNPYERLVPSIVVIVDESAPLLCPFTSRLGSCLSFPCLLGRVGVDERLQ